jgi:iron only hydrogenase large subunit-like protein
MQCTNFKQSILNAKLNKKIVIAQVSPIIYKHHQIVTSLKNKGFDYVFDNSDIVENGIEFLKRYNTGKLPLITSYCPDFLELVNSSYPELKSYLCISEKFATKNIYRVSIMPCRKIANLFITMDSFIVDESTINEESTMLASLKCIYKELTGEPLNYIDMRPNKIIPSIKESTIYIALRNNTILMIDVAIIYGLEDAKEYIKAMKLGLVKHYFIEIL